MVRVDADLICVDGRTGDSLRRSLLALRYSSKDIQFNNVILAAPERPCPDFDFVYQEIPKLESVEVYSEYMVKNLWRHFISNHAILVQGDGFITEPDLWDNEWLNYDYIGAPWPAFWPRREVYRVGNGGFSLRSKKLMERVSQMDYSKAVEKIEDNFICLDCRPILECFGFNFAPPYIAAQFSTENPTEYSCESFGFHGKNNPLCSLIK